MSHVDINDIDGWTSKFAHANIPILNVSFDKVKEAAGNSNAGSEKVTQAILKDASLTLQVLRIANTQASSGSINTVSDAVDQIGVDGVLGLCVSVMQLDSLKDHPQSTHLLRHFITGYHAAKIVHSILPEIDLEADEASFVCTLVMHISEMCFWSYINPQSERFHDLFSNKNLAADTIADDLLGTSFNEISKVLAKDWGLGEPLLDVLEDPAMPPKLVASIILADNIAHNVALKGWNCDEVNSLVSKFCEVTGIGLNKAKEMLDNTGKAAISELSAHGINNVTDYIPEN